MVPGTKRAVDFPPSSPQLRSLGSREGATPNDDDAGGRILPGMTVATRGVVVVVLTLGTPTRL